MVCKLIKKVAAKVAGKKTPKIEEKTTTVKTETACTKKAPFIAIAGYGARKNSFGFLLTTL